MVQIGKVRLASSLAQNAAKQLGITGLVKKLVRHQDCGGIRWSEGSLERNVTHVLAVADIVTRHVDVAGKVGAEIGPGDSLGTAYALLKMGASRLYAIEKFASVDVPTDAALSKALDKKLGGGGARVDHVQALFEDFRPGEPLDFVYSNDVLEHVAPEPVFRHAFNVLKAGGDFVHCVDFTGHGAFHNPQRPLDFLTCPDWLWVCMHSAMETTNRVRYSEILRYGEEAGFELVSVKVIRRATPEYLASVRPHLLPRFQRLSDEDLSAMQCEFHFRKPEVAQTSSETARSQRALRAIA
jgi:SAM-dependent methyltransferase